MSDGEIRIEDGRVAKMDQVRVYLELLFKAEESGDPFPVDLDYVWALAYGSKFAAKRALVTAKEFYADIDYHIHNPADVVGRPQGGGTQPERIVLTLQCFEYFIARKNRAVFEVYRQCRIKLTEVAKAQAAVPVIPYHIRRYIANHDQVPFGYFSILQEVVVKLIGPLEMHGCSLADNNVPDISVGLMFNAWLRKEKNYDTATFTTYDHKYEDGRIVQAKLYPLDLLGDFHTFFQTIWLGARALDYFGKRNEDALPFLQKMIEKGEAQSVAGALPAT